MRRYIYLFPAAQHVYICAVKINMQSMRRPTENGQRWTLRVYSISSTLLVALYILIWENCIRLYASGLGIILKNSSLFHRPVYLSSFVPQYIFITNWNWGKPLIHKHCCSHLQSVQQIISEQFTPNMGFQRSPMCIGFVRSCSWHEVPPTLSQEWNLSKRFIICLLHVVFFCFLCLSSVASTITEKSVLLHGFFFLGVFFFFFIIITYYNQSSALEFNFENWPDSLYSLMQLPV